MERREILSHVEGKQSNFTSTNRFKGHYLGLVYEGSTGDGPPIWQVPAPVPVVGVVAL